MARRRRRQRSRDSSWGAIALLAAVLIGAGALVYVYWRASQNLVAIDPESLCPTDAEPSAYFAIVLDASDPFNQTQRAAIKRQLDDLWKQVPARGEIRIFGLAVDDESPATEVFRVCSPGSAAGADPLTQNPARLQKRFDEYIEKLASEEQEWLWKEGTKVSPIMEALQVAALSFPVKTDKPRRIILVSDLLQHSKRFSLYGKSVPDFDQFKKSPAYPHLMADLLGASVEILFVRRDGSQESNLQQGTGLVYFWEKYFDSLGASVERVRQIEG